MTTKHNCALNASFTQLHTDYSDRVNRVLSSLIDDVEPSLLQEAMRYSLLAGGKRIRPFLVYCVGNMLGCELAQLDYPAAAIEMIHTYSLIHDDLPAMDNDSLRRGNPTCHVKFDEAHAILAGDALQTLAFSLLAHAPLLSSDCRIEMIKALSSASGATGMCLGQSLDLLAENKTVSLEQLNCIHKNKTGALIKAAVRFGLFAANDKAQCYQTQLDCYADAIGLAFQVQDDILDVIGDPALMGKTQGADQQLAKSTYPALMGLNKAIAMRDQMYQQAIQALNSIPYNSDPLKQLAEFIINRNC